MEDLLDLLGNKKTEFGAGNPVRQKMFKNEGRYY
jgi:hypothetical protein